VGLACVDPRAAKAPTSTTDLASVASRQATTNSALFSSEKPQPAGSPAADQPSALAVQSGAAVYPERLRNNAAAARKSVFCRIVLPQGARRVRALPVAWVPAAASALGVLALFALVVALRWRSHVSNVDDYLYALQTRQYLDALGDGPGALVRAWRMFGSNSPLVPMLALPVATVSTSPNALILVQALPLIVLLGSCRTLLRDLGLGGPASWVVAAAITTLPPVMGYAAMYHFAVAAAACTALAAAAYVRSDRLARRGPSLVVGLAVGLLSLTRVVAPVYVAALCVPLFVDVVVGKADRARRMRNAGWAALLGAVVAAPWWLATGRAAVDYLVSAGYGNTVFTHHGSRLSILADRLRWTATETGWLLAILLVALLLWTLVCVVRRVEGWRPLAWLLATSTLGVVLLGSSSNSGTAFALPFVVLSACAASAGALHMGNPGRKAVIGGSAAALVAPVLALVGLVPEVSVNDRPLWQERIPAIQQAWDALGCHCRLPNTDALSRDVLDVIGRQPTLIGRDDAVLNAEGLRYHAVEQDSLASLAAPPDGRTVTPRLLSSVRYVLGGTTFGSYHPGINPIGLFVGLRAAHFHPVYTKRLSRGNTIVVWAAR
jgi:hypothetical protein